MQNLSRKLLDAREKSEMSLSELAARTGIAKSTLQRYETGVTKKIPSDAIEKIAAATDMPRHHFYGGTGAEKPNLSLTDARDVTEFRVIGDIAAGYDRLVSEDWSGETVEIPNSYLYGRKKEDFIVLRVKGDSMYPLYLDGDKVLILKQTTLNHSGEIGAVLYNDELVTIKKVEYAYGEDWLRLVPVNPEFKPQHIEGEELEHCKVIGIPKLLIREF